MPKELPEKKTKLVNPTISKRQHKGYVYNVTTETGNLFVEDILVHNSGGLGTPAHLRVESGLIHKSSGGVLFLDEIATLSYKSQQELLSAIQDKKFAITGQSENSSGAMTRTEPVPCFPGDTVLSFKDGEKNIGEFVDSQIHCNKNKIIKDGLVEYLDINGHKIQSYFGGKIVYSKINRVYRRKYCGRMIRIKFDDGDELLATPEHPIKTESDFVKAEDLAVGDKIEARLPSTIIDGQNILRHYSKDNGRIAKAYEKWKKNNHLSFKELGVDYKTVKAWQNGAIPHGLKTIYWLTERNLLPLSVDDKRLPIIARITGALFGDGGLDGRRLSRLYFSAARDAGDDIKELLEDLVEVFGEELRSSFSIRETSSLNGEGLELSVNKAEIARFFYSLGVPKGDKVSQTLTVPWWVKYSEKTRKEFFSSLITCELYGKIRSSQDVPNFVMAKIKRLEHTHINFLNELRKFLAENRVETSELKQDKDYIKTKNLPFPEKCGTYSFKINSNYSNLINFSNAISFPYSREKRESFNRVLEKGKDFIRNQKRICSMKSRAKELRKKGRTLRGISKETNISLNTVMKTVGPTYNKYSEKLKFDVQKMIESGSKPKAIANEYDIPYTTVLYWRKQVV